MKYVRRMHFNHAHLSAAGPSGARGGHLPRSTKETQQPAPAVLWPSEDVEIWWANVVGKNGEKQAKIRGGRELIISANFMENFTSVHCSSLITRIALVSCHLQINSRRPWDFFFSFCSFLALPFPSLCASHAFMRQNLKV